MICTKRTMRCKNCRTTGGFADAENGLMYGASNWDDMYKEDHEVQELQDDGVTVKKVWINEAANIKTAMDTGKKPPGGLWVGGVKYKIINKNTFEVGDGEECPGLLAQRTNGGLFMLSRNGSFTVGLYDENKGQNTGNCINCVCKNAV